MTQKVKSFLDKLTMIVVSLVGMAGFVTQSIQYFTGKWTDSFYKELVIWVLYFVVARYPSKILSVFEGIKTRVFGKNSVNKNNKE